MNYENMILNVAKENDGIITSKKVDELKIPRFYLAKLLKENKIIKIDRGIYSTGQESINEYYNLQLKSKFVIFSHFTALKMLGFYKYEDLNDQIIVPQGYNASRLNNFKVFYDNDKIYLEGVVEVVNEDNHKIKVYDLERSICDIIKNKNRFKIDQVNKLINYYFTKESLNYQKLLYYSKLLKVSTQVQYYLSLFKA